MPHNVSDAMNIALYAMFVAIIMPSFKTDSNKRKAIILSILLSFLFTYIPFFKIGSGWTIIIITVLVSGVMAICYPIKEEPCNK